MRIGLALGGGFARGIAHIGVLKALEELGVQLSLIAGTSAGSIIGALFAAGYTVSELTHIARHTTWRDLSHLVVPRRSVLGATRLEKKLDEFLVGKSFADLDLPFFAVCTDLYSAEKVILRSGPVASAVRASCSAPGIFPPVERAGRLLVDGGMMENVPVMTAREMGAQYAIGVDLYASITEQRRIGGIVDVLLRSFEISQRLQCLPQSQSADVCIMPQLAGESLVDLSRTDQYIERGYEAAILHRDDLLRLKELGKQGRGKLSPSD